MHLLEQKRALRHNSTPAGLLLASASARSKAADVTKIEKEITKLTQLHRVYTTWQPHEPRYQRALQRLKAVKIGQ